MPIYAFKGINKSGKEVKSTITCESLPVAKQRVKNNGIMLIDIKEQKSDMNSPQGGLSFSIGKSVNVNDLALMTRQLSTLIKAKIQIVEALSALMDQVENPTLRIVLSEVKQKVNEGTSLSNALKDYPKIFNNVYVNMVDAGEASGTLDIVLLRLAEFTEAQVKLKNRIISAMLYPTIMMTVGFLIIGVLFVKIIPQIAQMFTSYKGELPTLTQICINISEFLQNYWIVALVSPFIIFWLFKKWTSTKKGLYRWHKVQLSIPVLGQLVTMINISRFCSTLSTLLNSGVPILTSLTIVKNLVPNVLMKDAIDEARVSIAEGGPLAGPLKNSGLYPPMVTHMIALGEKSGEVESMLDIISENYEDQVETRLDGLTSILEPLMMIFMGGIVGVVVFAVVIPMMEMNSIR